MIFNTYKKYIINLFSKTLMEVILVFFSLILIINLFEEINFLRDQNVSGYYPVFLALLNAPSIIFDILPFIFLISTLLFFIKLINKSELSIFKYTGITNNQILSIIVHFGRLPPVRGGSQGGVLDGGGGGFPPPGLGRAQ